MKKVWRTIPIEGRGFIFPVTSCQLTWSVGVITCKSGKNRHPKVAVGKAFLLRAYLGPMRNKGLRV